MTTSVPLIGVTGSTEELGGRVASRPAARGQRQRLIVRDLGRALKLSGAEVVQAAYEDGAAMSAAASIRRVMSMSAREGFDLAARLDHRLYRN